MKYYLDHEVLCVLNQVVGVSFKRSPCLCREDFVRRQAVEKLLMILEEARQTINELAGLTWWRVIEASDSLLEYNASNCCTTKVRPSVLFGYG